MFSDRVTCANYVDPIQTSRNAVLMLLDTEKVGKWTCSKFRSIFRGIGVRNSESLGCILYVLYYMGRPR